MPKRTPLTHVHEEAGARLTEFAGYMMPIQYSSILQEHEAVRSSVGVFDVSHMGNLWVRGAHAAETLSRAFLADAAKVPVGGTKYTCALRDDGTIIDDLYIFHTPTGFHVVPNAGQHDVVATRLGELGDAEVVDATEATAILAVQGPNAAKVVAGATGHDVSDIQRFHLSQAPELGEHAFLSRTGYTGEDGFELFFPADRAEDVWKKVVDLGATPCGLGARDTLRLEKGYCLAGNEFTPPRTPLEAGLGWLVDWGHDFAGKKRLVEQKERGDHQRLVGLRVLGRGIPRRDCEVLQGDQQVGVVSSGSQSPTLRKGIALAYVSGDLVKPGTEVKVRIRSDDHDAEVVKLPFI